MRYSKLSSFFILLLAGLVLTGQSCLTRGSGTKAANTLGMFRSDDKGETWKEINALPTSKGIKSLNNIKVYRFFTDPSDPDAVYATTRSQGVYYSYDRGENWREVPDLAGKFVYTVAVDPKNKCILYANDATSIYKSTDCARTWTVVYAEIRPGEEVQSVAVDYGNSQTLYAALSGGETIRGDVLVSSDAGKSWQQIRHVNMDVRLLVTDPLTPRRVYVAGIGQNAGLLRSDDGGVTWHDITTGLQKFPENLDFRRLILHPSKKNSLFWVSKYGIVRSDDAGVTWTEYRTTLSAGSVDIYSFGVNPTNDNELYFTATAGGESNVSTRLYKSTDGGKNWINRKMPTATIPVTMYIHPKDTKVILLGFTSFK